MDYKRVEKDTHTPDGNYKSGPSTCEGGQSLNSVADEDFALGGTFCILQFNIIVNKQKILF